MYEKEQLIAVQTLFYEFSDWRSGFILWVHDLRVRKGEEARSAEIAAALNVEVYSYMKSRDMRCLRWVVSKQKKQLVDALVDMKFVDGDYFIY